MAFRGSSISTPGTDGGGPTVSISITSRSTRAPSRCTRTPDAPTLHVDQPDGSAVVHSRSLDECARATVPSTSSALAHVPESSSRRFRRATSRRSTTPRVSPHRRLRGRGTSSRAGVPAAATAIDRFSRPSQRIDARLSGVSRIVVGRIVQEPGPAVVYLRIPATPIFANIGSDSDGRMSCPTHLPSAGSSAHTLRDRCPSPFLR